MNASDQEKRMHKKIIILLTFNTIFAINGMEKPLSEYARTVKKVTVSEKTKTSSICHTVYIDDLTTIGTIKACIAELNQINPSVLKIYPLVPKWYTVWLTRVKGPELAFTESIRRTIQKYKTTQFICLINNSEDMHENTQI
jgi:hypothetical protein